VLVDPCDAWLGERYTWHIAKTGYVVTFVREGGKHYCLLLHRAVMQPQPNEHVDHLFHNRLDNRRSMLRNLTPRQNNFNRKGAPSNTSTGERNVYLMKDGFYRVEVRGGGKRLRSQKRMTKEEACVVAAQFRQEIANELYA